MPEPSLSLVVPTLTGEVEALLASVTRQTRPPDEVSVVEGVRPSGRARNIGVARTAAPIIVFADDDAVLGSDTTLDRLVTPLSDPSIGVVGASKLVPPGSTPFQLRVARQVPRIEHPVVDRLTESNPPVDRHGYTDVTTTCCAMRREVLEECDGFDEDLVRGVDSELFYRVRRAGYRLVLAPNTWAWHPPPATRRRLLAKHFRYGCGYAQTVRKHPELAAGRYLSTPLHAAGYVLARTAWLAPHALLPYTHADPARRLGWKPLRAAASYSAACGYVYGWYAYPPRSVV